MNPTLFIVVSGSHIAVIAFSHKQFAMNDYSFVGLHAIKERVSATLAHHQTIKPNLSSAQFNVLQTQ